MSKRKPQTISARTGLPKQGQQGEGGGRPPFEIDYEAVKKLAGIQCTQTEIAAWLGDRKSTRLNSSHSSVSRMPSSA